MMRACAVALLLVVPTVHAATAEAAAAAKTEAGANPIRKVVTMLQMMMKKIEAEGKKETELHDKYMCYCETSSTTLGASIEEANTKIPQLEADIKVSTETKVKLDEEIKQAMTDRTAAKEAMAQATAMRTKESSAFAKESSNDASNLDALTKALA